MSQQTWCHEVKWSMATNYTPMLLTMTGWFLSTVNQALLPLQ